MLLVYILLWYVDCYFYFLIVFICLGYLCPSTFSIWNRFVSGPLLYTAYSWVLSCKPNGKLTSFLYSASDDTPEILITSPPWSSCRVPCKVSQTWHMASRDQEHLLSTFISLFPLVVTCELSLHWSWKWLGAGLFLMECSPSPQFDKGNRPLTLIFMLF